MAETPSNPATNDTHDEHETHIEYTAERLETVRAAKPVPAQVQLGPPNFNFRKEFGIAWIYNERGKVVGFTTTPEGVRQMTNFLRWKEVLPAHEVAAGRYAEMLVDCINQEKGTFLRDELGGYHIVLDGQSRIPIDPEAPELKRFLLDVCDITTCSPDAVMTIERLKVHADCTASKMLFRRFSAMYEGELSRVYLPTANEGKLLLITSREIALVPNGNNYDQVWLEHPEQNPFKYQVPESIDDVRGALRTFEELIVDSQACAAPAMRWFVAMAEAVFPLVRDTVSNRFIMVHKGAKGHGKTTGAKSPVLLHGFEDVFMDASVAALGNIPEQGLVVIDNKEAKNFTQPLIDYFLSIATGGKRLRSLEGGTAVRRNAPRPVAVITSIEGVHKAELHDRCIDVKYFLDADQERLKRGALEQSIIESRHRVMSGLAVVLQEYLTTRRDPVARQILAFVNPIDRFSEHFEEICYLLLAYGRVTLGAAGDAWAAKLIHAWDCAIRDTRGDDALDAAVSALEAPVLAAAMDGHIPVPFTWQDVAGKLYVVYPGDILSALQRNLALRDLPTEPGQLVQRLESEHFERFVFLTGRTLGADGEPISELRRKKHGQPVGLFVPNDAG